MVRDFTSHWEWPSLYGRSIKLQHSRGKMRFGMKRGMPKSARDATQTRLSARLATAVHSATAFMPSKAVSRMWNINKQRVRNAWVTACVRHTNANMATHLTPSSTRTGPTRTAHRQQKATIIHTAQHQHTPHTTHHDALTGSSAPRAAPLPVSRHRSPPSPTPI